MKEENDMYVDKWGQIWNLHFKDEHWRVWNNDLGWGLWLNGKDFTLVNNENFIDLLKVYPPLPNLSGDNQ